jgi:hypothetical protein
MNDLKHDVIFPFVIHAFFSVKVELSFGLTLIVRKPFKAFYSPKAELTTLFSSPFFPSYSKSQSSAKFMSVKTDQAGSKHAEDYKETMLFLLPLVVRAKSCTYGPGRELLVCEYVVLAHAGHMRLLLPHCT